MVDSEAVFFSKILKEFRLDGTVVELTPRTAADIVRHLGQQGYVCAGGVLPGNRFGDHSDNKIISKELGILRANYDPDATDFVVGPHVMGVDDENGPTYYSRGAMLFVRPREIPQQS